MPATKKQGPIFMPLNQDFNNSSSDHPQVKSGDNVAADNPLIYPPQLPGGAPAFDLIKPEHFIPALDWALQKANEGVAAIRDNPAPPTFENTVEALEFAETELLRVGSVISWLSDNNNAGQKEQLSEALQTKIASYKSGLLTDDVLFARLDAVYRARGSLNLDGEQKMLLEEKHKMFVRNGALLDPNQKHELLDIEEKLAALSQKFADNISQSRKARRKSWGKKPIDDEHMLEELPAEFIETAKADAEKAGMPGKWLINPASSDIIFHAKNRSLREEGYKKLYSATACEDPFDNRVVIMDIIRLRQQKAELLMGSPTNYASYVLADRMAGTPGTVMTFLEKTSQAYQKANTGYLEKFKALALEDGVVPVGMQAAIHSKLHNLTIALTECLP